MAERIEEEAADALASLGDPSALDPLVAMLREKNYRFRFAEAALETVQEPRCVDRLVSIMADQKTDQAVRVALARILQSARGADARAVDTLLAALTDARAEVRDSAAMSLAKLGDAHAAEPLVQILSRLRQTWDDSERRRQVEQLLLGLGEAAVNPLLEGLETWRRGEARDARRKWSADGARQARRSALAVLQYLSWPRVREVYAQAAGEILSRWKPSDRGTCGICFVGVLAREGRVFKEMKPPLGYNPLATGRLNFAEALQRKMMSAARQGIGAMDDPSLGWLAGISVRAEQDFKSMSAEELFGERDEWERWAINAPFSTFLRYCMECASDIAVYEAAVDPGNATS